MSRLPGRRIVITGATGGIGQALTRKLSAAGAQLAVTGRSAASLAELAKLEGVVVAESADITDEEATRGFVQAAARALDGVDALVTLAAKSVPGPITEASVQDYHDVMGGAVTGTFLACKHIMDIMQPGGLIINVASMAGVRPNATAPLYCTAKAAAGMFSQAFGMQAAERGIRVSLLNPGGVDTPFWGDRPIDRSKLLSAEDVVYSVLFLLELPDHVVVRDLQFESTGAAH